MGPTPTELTESDAASTAVGCPADHHGYQPFEMDDPFDAYARLRRDEPVMYDERIGYWVVSVGAVGIGVELARQGLRARSPHQDDPQLLVTR